MGTFAKNHLNILLVLSVSVLVNCNGGGGTGSEVGIICGMLFDTCGNPARNVLVTVRFSDYLAPVGAGQLGKRVDVSSRVAVCTTYTDGNGEYEFAHGTINREGVYCIEAWAERKESCIFISTIKIETIDYPFWYRIDTPFVHTDRTLKPPVSLSGTVFPVHDSTRTFVRVFGLDVCVPVGGNGAFRLDSLPQGEFQMQVVTMREAPSYDTVHISVGQDTTAMPDTIIPSVYRVVYFGNGGASDAVPVDGQWYDDGEKIVVLDGGDGLTRSGFDFIGWNTRVDGSGSMYYAGDTLLKGDDRISLYAQWAENRYLLTVTGNGTVTGSDSVAYGIPHTIIATPDTAYGFIVWRVISGSAVFADSTAAATAVTLKGGDAVVEAVFGPVETFVRSFDGRLNLGACVRQTSDDGYVMVGSTGGDSACDIYLVKTTAAGDTIWTRKFGGSGNDEAYAIQQTDDGGYIIVGSTTSFGAGGEDVYLIRTDEKGDTVWTAAIGGAGDDVGRSVVQADVGGFVIAGYTSSFGNGVDDVYFMKVDANGQVLWSGFSGGDHWVRAYSVIRTGDGNYLAVGNADSRYTEGHTVVWLTKFNDEGDTLWVKGYGGPDFYWAIDVQQTADGGYIIVGCTKIEYNFNLPLNSNEIYLIKTDGDGDTIWTKRYDNHSVGEGHTVVQTADGGYLIGGNYMERSSVYPGFLLKTTSTGEECWHINYGDSENNYVGTIVSMQQTTDGGLIIGAGAMSLVKTDALGRFQ